jgi:hypothetical protein
MPALPTTLDLLLVVHVEDVGGRSSHIRLANDEGKVSLEMFAPDLRAWIEELNGVGRITRLRIDSRQITCLAQIAIDAREAKVIEIVRATVFAWNDVLDL